MKRFAMVLGRLIAVLAIWPLAAWGQEPAITGVVGAASYATASTFTSTSWFDGIFPQFLEEGSIATIFGTNLASATAEATGVPLPWRLAGTSVSVDGNAAPLFYVSPTQINFQMPSGGPAGISSANGIVVGTSAGLSDPYTLVADFGGSENAVGVFSQSATGCGPGAVLNVGADGSVSLNSPTNSAEPGSYITVYGTGISVLSAPPDGEPASFSSTGNAELGASGFFDFTQWDTHAAYSWQGLAPGFVGLAQFNFMLPITVREGCTVPLQLQGWNMSQPVTISIAEGGGKCVDPPSQGYGEIAWEKTVTTAALATYEVTETDTLTVSLQSSPGRQAPAPPPYAQLYAQQMTLATATTYYGPPCAIPGYRSLGAGTVTAQGPGFGPLQATTTPLQGGTVLAVSSGVGGLVPVPPAQSGQVAGLTVYQATLSSGSVKPGAFTVSASGGSDVGAFQSTVQVGSPIQIIGGQAGSVFYCGEPYTLTWTGGDPDAWVTVKWVRRDGSEDRYDWAWLARASDHALTLTCEMSPYAGLNMDMVVEVFPDPSAAPSFSPSGLSLGGVHTWKYTYRYEGIQVQP